MVTSVPKSINTCNLGFSVFDELSYSDKTLPFGGVLSADRIREIFAEHNVLFGYGDDDIWNTGLTLWSFVGQVLQDGKQSSCNAAVTQATRYMVEHGIKPPSPDSGEYCRARKKLNVEVIRQIVRETTEKMSSAIPDSWLWHGKHVKLVDGFTLTMPDTPENQKEFPQAKTQKPGVGFPIARACVVLSLATACIEDIAIGPYAGKETGETALLRQLLHCFKPGDLLLADSCFCSFFMLAILKSRGVDVCMKLHQCRQTDYSNVKWLGKNDYIDIWDKPQKAKWMSQELYDTLPETMEIRVTTFNAKTNDQAEELNVTSTLLDQKVYPSRDIGGLYGYRWCAELDIFSIKEQLNVGQLRCKSPKMVRIELWTILLAYNMVRVVCAQAAHAHEKLPRQMSFTIACNTLLSQWITPPKESIRQELGQYFLLQIARNG